MNRRVDKIHVPIFMFKLSANHEFTVTRNPSCKIFLSDAFLGEVFATIARTILRRLSNTWLCTTRSSALTLPGSAICVHYEVAVIMTKQRNVSEKVHALHENQMVALLHGRQKCQDAPQSQNQLLRISGQSSIARELIDGHDSNSVKCRSFLQSDVLQLRVNALFT